LTVLVTGGAGYIGSHMVLALLDVSEHVIVLDNLSTGFRNAVPKNVTFIEGDIGNISLLRELIKEHNIESIIHFAAKIEVPESVEKPLQYYENNTIKAHSLISAAVSEGIKHFIFSSTAAVYGDVGDKLVCESHPLIPLSPYGRSKLMVEEMLQDVAIATDLKCVILRYFNVAGADPKGRSGQSNPNATHLIKVAVQTALGFRNKIFVFGTDYPTPDGTCIRDYIQVSDLCQAHIDALRYLRSGGQTIICNCGYGKGFSVLDVIEAVKRNSELDFCIELTDRRTGDSSRVVADNAKIKRYLGWQPKNYDIDRIIQQVLDWEKRLIEQPM
jgi:UDP-glucose 4-epimerase